MRGNDHTILKRANKQLILNTICDYSPITIEDIVFRTRLSRPTVVNLMKELQEAGIIDRVGVTKSVVGRSAQLFQIGSERYFSIGVDIEFPVVRLVAADLRTQIVYSSVWCHELMATAESVIRRLLDELDIAIDKTLSGGTNRNVIGICIGMPGLLDLNRNLSLNIERIQNWTQVALKDIVEERFHIPTQMSNDVHLLAQIHKKQRMECGIQNYVYISLRSGVGMAMFLNGELFEGTMGNAGFIGHTILDLQGNECRCGKRGCLESVIGEQATLARYLELSPAQEEEHPVDYMDFLRRFSNGEPLAAEAMRQSFYGLGVEISNIIKTLDIPYVVINGLPEINKPMLLDWVRQGIHDYLLEGIFQNVTIVDEQLCENEKALGGALAVTQKFFEDPKLNLTPDPQFGNLLETDGEALAVYSG